MLKVDDLETGFLNGISSLEILHEHKKRTEISSDSDTIIYFFIALQTPPYRHTSDPQMN